MKRLILVTSPPACGKTYISKKLAENLKHVVYLDKDTLIPLSKKVFEAAGEPYDRSSAFFEKYIRDAEYVTILALAFEALKYDDIVLINAPFTQEVRNSAYINDLKKRLVQLNTKLTVIWVQTDVEVCKQRMLLRNSDRDTWKVEHWDEYVKGVDFSIPAALDDPDVLAEAYDPDMYWYGDLDRDAWVAFVKYEDSDGFYFLQEGWLVSETKEIAWTYYPPERFKILLYFPESGTFAVSGILERYAFDTYYTVKMNGKGMENVEYDEENSTNERYDAWLEAERSYDFKWELISFALRMVMTVAVEILIALPFGYRRGRQLAVILAANCGTQIILNVLLNVVNFYSGEWAFVLAYVLLELLVFAVEAVIFSLTLHKYANEVLGEKPPTRIRAVIYALVANAVSFAVGILISMFIPGIF